MWRHVRRARPCPRSSPRETDSLSSAEKPSPPPPPETRTRTTTAARAAVALSPTRPTHLPTHPVAENPTDGGGWWAAAAATFTPTILYGWKSRAAAAEYGRRDSTAVSAGPEILTVRPRPEIESLVATASVALPMCVCQPSALPSALRSRRRRRRRCTDIGPPGTCGPADAFWYWVSVCCRWLWCCSKRV